MGSVPPSVLQHAGRDMGSKPNSPPGVTSTQLWKQTRRRRLSGTRKTGSRILLSSIIFATVGNTKLKTFQNK